VPSQQEVRAPPPEAEHHRPAISLATGALPEQVAKTTARTPSPSRTTSIPPVLANVSLMKEHALVMTIVVRAAAIVGHLQVFQPSFLN
jgi:hypothetical protein